MRVLPVALACALVVAFAREAAPASGLAPLTAEQVAVVMSEPGRHVRAAERNEREFAHVVERS